VGHSCTCCLRWLVAVCSLLGAGASRAADLGERELDSSGPVLAYQWSGFYSGLSAGNRWTELGAVLHRLDTGSVERLAFAPKGFVGGTQAGYLTQIGHMVAGIEVSYAGGLLTQDTKVSSIQPDRTRTLALGNAATATLRAGWAQDRWLVYAKGGLAAARINVRSNMASTGQMTSESSESGYGWTVGTGIEYALTDTISAGLEYDYISIAANDRGQSQSAGFSALAHEAVQAGAHILTARLNYKFTR
jgi:outer membrane immunogenic protein